MGRNFDLIGVTGFIAVRHLRAIRETGNNIVAALDRFDSVGLLDNGTKGKIYDIDLAYITSRGNWYDISWKGNI